MIILEVNNAWFLSIPLSVFDHVARGAGHLPVHGREDKNISK